MTIKHYLQKHLHRFWNFWPPLFFSGIKIEKVAPDYSQIHVRLKLRFWNANYLGTQYGGSIYSMVDPFYMIMLIKNLDHSFQIWDKAAHIRFLRPGKTDLFATFHLNEDDLALIRATMMENEKMDWARKVEIRDKNGELVAEVDKIISIKKPRHRPTAPQN